MEHKEDREILRKGGFAENEVLLLSELRTIYTERERRRVAADYRRLEFIRWLVTNGKLTDQIA